MNQDYYFSLFPAYTRDKPRFAALAEAILRQVTDLMDLVPQVASGFSFASAEGVQLDTLGESVGSPRQEGWNDATYRSVLRKKLKLFSWDGTNEASFDYLDEGEILIDHDDGTVTAQTLLPLPAEEVLPVPIGVKTV